MIVFNILLILAGIVLLVGGAEIFVRSATSVAKRLGMSNIVIGLTVVAFGTSAPELVVNVISALSGTTDLAVSNIVGSNFANILLILGIGAMIRSLRIKQETTTKQIPFALLAIVVAAVMGNDALLNGGTDNIITRGDGVVLIMFFLIFMYYTYGVARVVGEEDNVETYRLSTTTLMFIAGILGLIFGGKVIVENAVSLATLAGLSESLIGLTIVAVGTSLPELATTVVAVRRGHIDLAIGNAIGSNIFNIFWVLGFTALLAPIPVDPSTNTDFVATIFATALLFGFIFIHKRNHLQRWQGVLFVLLYIGYISLAIFRG